MLKTSTLLNEMQTAQYSQCLAIQRFAPSATVWQEFHCQLRLPKLDASFWGVKVNVGEGVENGTNRNLSYLTFILHHRLMMHRSGASIFLTCVTVAKLSNALAWLSCVRSRERSEF